MKALILLDINGVLNLKLVRAGDDTDPLNVLKKILTAAMAVLVMGLTITACAEKEPNAAMSDKATPEKTISARDERDRVVELVTNTTKQLDVTGWWPRNGVAGAHGCSLGTGKKGASYGYDHWAPQGTSHIEDAKRVAEYWESLGMTVRTVNPTTHPTVFAEDGPVLRAEFDTDAADKSYSVGATAPAPRETLGSSTLRIRPSVIRAKNSPR